MMDPGTLNRRVTLQHRVQDVDGIGQPIDLWEDVAKPWANIRHLNGTEAIKAGAAASIVKASIRIRYRLGIDAGMRVLHKAVVYEIKAVMLDEIKRQHVDLVCEVVS